MGFNLYLESTININYLLGMANILKGLSWKTETSLKILIEIVDLTLVKTNYRLFYYNRN